MVVQDATRVDGSDLMLALCAGAARESVPVGDVWRNGGGPVALQKRLREELPELEVVYAHAPPFGSAMDEEGRAATMSRAGVRILFVALGCPRQERWIARNGGRVPAVMVVVGAAFNFLAGSKPQAPALLQTVGL